MKTKWFQNVHNLDELRKEYRRLALLHHPDRGGSTQDMQQINAEYEYLSKNLINANNDFSEARKTYEHQVSQYLRDKINEIINIAGISIEVIGSWIWVTGNTFAVKDALKTAGFQFSHNKSAWYWHHGEYRKNNGAMFNLDDIRQMWGSTTINPDDDTEKQNINHKNLKHAKSNKQRSPAA